MNLLPRTVRRGVVYCGVCGHPMHSTVNNRHTYCLTSLTAGSPGHGHPLPWHVPLRLFDQHREGRLSAPFERYLEWSCGRYWAALARLRDERPQLYATYLATVVHDRTTRSVADEWGRPHGTICTWKRRALLYLRDALGTEEQWERAASEREERRRRSLEDRAWLVATNHPTPPHPMEEAA